MRRYASFASTRSNRYIGSSESNGDLPLRSRSHITSSFWIPRYLVTDSSVEHELLQEGKISSAGTSLSRPEIEALLAERFPVDRTALLRTGFFSTSMSRLSRSRGFDLQACSRCSCTPIASPTTARGGSRLADGCGRRCARPMTAYACLRHGTRCMC